MKVFGVALLLATALSPVAVFGQGDTDDLEPAVDTSAALDEAASYDPAVDTSATEDTGAADADPAAGDEPETVLAADVTRRTSPGGVMDEMTLTRTEITGNQELPKVLYIVPWRKADPGDLMGRPVNSLLDEVLAPLDREEFTRQVEYYDDLYGEE